MEDDAAVIYGLEFQARALTAQSAETELIRFLVGTQSLKCDNQVHQIDFDEENNHISKNVFMHRVGEVWHISASPNNKDVLATCYNIVVEGKCEMRSSIWRLPSANEENVAADDSSSTPPSLELLTDLNLPDNAGTDVKCRFCIYLPLSVRWQPSDGEKVFSLVDNHIYLWDIVSSGTSAKMVTSWDVEGKSHAKLTTGTWNPHQNCTQIATTNDTFVRVWDLRSQQQAFAIENAHATLVRDIDFNPNKQYYIASCGDDCKVKFWDIRNCDEPLKVLDSHSHWVWCVRYNHFHDQLLLSSSSDSRVVLSNVASLSSEPYGHLLDDDATSENSDENGKETIVPPNQDRVISTYEEHEDSVYAVEWSSADPWLFASLSYDGRLIINRVPKAVKYKILL